MNRNCKRCVIVASMCALGATAASTAWAGSYYSIDQANTAAPSQNYNVSGLAPLQQSIRPTLSGANRVELRLADVGVDIGPGTRMQVAVYQTGNTGTPLALSQITNVPDNASGYYKFDFASVVPFRANTSYSFELRQLDTGAGRQNFMWTTSNGNTYASGAPSANGATPVGDFLFTSGLVQNNRADLQAETSGVVGSVAVVNGARNVQPGSALIGGQVATTPQEYRGIREFNAASFFNVAEGALNVARLTGSVGVNNSFGSGPRDIAIQIYGGNGALDLADFDTPAVTVDTFTLQVGGTTSYNYDLDVLDEIAALRTQGFTSFGVRFTPLNSQGFSGSTDTVLTLQTAGIPEPGTACLALTGLATLALRRQRRPAK